MILTDEKIKELILHPANEAIIKRGRELYTEHIRHVKGIGVEQFFIDNEIKGYENEEEKLLRHKTSRATTVPIYASALGTFDKAYSASGYSRYFEFKGNAQEQSKKLELYLNKDVGDGMNMSHWMQYKWGDKIHYDTNGVLMCELPKITPEQGLGADAKPYLIFKSILDIHDYALNGTKVQYLILIQECSKEDTGKGVKRYRVIDSVRDVIVEVSGSDITVLNSEEYPQLENVWGYVPALVISNQKDAKTRAHQSFIWESIGIADDYLLDSSIQNISKKKHGFPQKWSYAVPCKTCDGSHKLPIYGEYDNSSRERPIVNYIPCKDCNATGSIRVSPSMSVIKPMPDAANPDIGDPFGYVVPDIDSIRFQVEELEREEKIIHEAIWAESEVESKSKSAETATGRVLDANKKLNKLDRFSTNGEMVEEFLTDCIGRAIFRESFVSSIVRWGRKYHHLTENQIEEMLKSAKEAGVNSSILKAYMEELIYVRYSTDSIELQRQLKLFEAEPFVHMTVDEVQNLKYAATSDKFLKTYFNDYIEEINRKKPQIIQFGTTEMLINELKALNAKKMSEAKAEEPTQQ